MTFPDVKPTNEDLFIVIQLMETHSLGHYLTAVLFFMNKSFRSVHLKMFVKFLACLRRVLSLTYPKSMYPPPPDPSKYLITMHLCEVKQVMGLTQTECIWGSNEVTHVGMI